MMKTIPATILRGSLALLVGIIFLLTAGAAGAAEAVVEAPKPKPVGVLDVTVVADGGKEWKKCSVIVKDRLVPLEGKSASYVFAGVPVGDVAVTAEALVGQGLLKGDQRYLGVSKAVVAGGRTTPVTVTLRPVERVNDFCAACHPGPGEELKPGQIRRDLHKTDLPLLPEALGKVKVYNALVDKLEKEGKPHNWRIPIEEREVLEAGKRVKKSFFTCESCHTPHLATPFTKNARGSFRTGSDLCRGCH
jgi:predicted CXXCH cytochrome family protein